MYTKKDEVNSMKELDVVSSVDAVDGVELDNEHSKSMVAIPLVCGTLSLDAKVINDCGYGVDISYDKDGKIRSLYVTFDAE